MIPFFFDRFNDRRSRPTVVSNYLLPFLPVGICEPLPMGNQVNSGEFSCSSALRGMVAGTPCSADKCQKQFSVVERPVPCRSCRNRFCAEHCCRHVLLSSDNLAEVETTNFREARPVPICDGCFQRFSNLFQQLHEQRNDIAIADENFKHITRLVLPSGDTSNPFSGDEMASAASAETIANCIDRISVSLPLLPSSTHIPKFVHLSRGQECYLDSLLEATRAALQAFDRDVFDKLRVEADGNGNIIGPDHMASLILVKPLVDLACFEFDTHYVQYQDFVLHHNDLDGDNLVLERIRQHPQFVRDASGRRVQRTSWEGCGWDPRVVEHIRLVKIYVRTILQWARGLDALILRSVLQNSAVEERSRSKSATRRSPTPPATAPLKSTPPSSTPPAEVRSSASPLAQPSTPPARSTSASASAPSPLSTSASSFTLSPALAEPVSDIPAPPLLDCESPMSSPVKLSSLSLVTTPESSPVATPTTPPIAAVSVQAALQMSPHAKSSPTPPRVASILSPRMTSHGHHSLPVPTVENPVAQYQALIEGCVIHVMDITSKLQNRRTIAPGVKDGLRSEMEQCTQELDVIRQEILDVLQASEQPCTFPDAAVVGDPTAEDAFEDIPLSPATGKPLAGGAPAPVSDDDIVKLKSMLEYIEGFRSQLSSDSPTSANPTTGSKNSGAGSSTDGMGTASGSAAEAGRGWKCVNCDGDLLPPAHRFCPICGKARPDDVLRNERVLPALAGTMEGQEGDLEIEDDSRRAAAANLRSAESLFNTKGSYPGYWRESKKLTEANENELQGFRKQFESLEAQLFTVICDLEGNPEVDKEEPNGHHDGPSSQPAHLKGVEKRVQALTDKVSGLRTELVRKIENHRQACAESSFVEQGEPLLRYADDILTNAQDTLKSVLAVKTDDGELAGHGRRVASGKVIDEVSKRMHDWEDDEVEKGL